MSFDEGRATLTCHKKTRFAEWAESTIVKIHVTSNPSAISVFSHQAIVDVTFTELEILRKFKLIRRPICPSEKLKLLLMS